MNSFTIGIRLFVVGIILASVFVMLLIQFWTNEAPNKVVITTNEYGEHLFEFLLFLVTLPLSVLVCLEYLVLVAEKQVGESHV